MQILGYSENSDLSTYDCLPGGGIVRLEENTPQEVKQQAEG